MLLRSATYFTPELFFGDGVCRITGKLWMENPSVFFEEIIRYTKNTRAKNILLELNVEHLNSSSIKQLLQYFILLKELNEKGKFDSVDVIWSIPGDDIELIDLASTLESISELHIVKKHTL